MDNIDKVIWVLPFLGVLDVVSTLYVSNLGYPLKFYETGVLANFFIFSGLTYVYIFVYLAILVFFSYLFWYIKNERLISSRFPDKILFLLLLGVVFYIYMRLTATFSINFLLPFLISGNLSNFSVSLLIYLSTAFTLVLYTWQDVIRWISENENRKN